MYLNHGASDHIRVMTWISAVKMWGAHPWIGCGAESYVDAWHAFRSPAWITAAGESLQDHAHNSFLESLAAFGVLGYAAYLNLLRRLCFSGFERKTAAALVSIFICSQFNAVPFAVLFVAALLAGGKGSSPYPIRERGFPAAAAALLALLFSYLLAVDSIFFRARRSMDFAGIQRSMSLNPAEILYQTHAADLLTRKFISSEDNNDINLLLRALDISRSALARHPGSVQARHMLTQTLCILAQLDPRYLHEAQESAVILHRLDPTLNFEFKVVRRPQ